MNKKYICCIVVALVSACGGSLPIGGTPSSISGCYRTNGSNLVTIVAYNMESSGCNTSNIVIPSVIGQSTVVAIGDNVFSNKNLTNIQLPYTVESIGNNAFANNQLTIIQLPNNLIRIGANAFSNNNLATPMDAIVIPSGVNYIGAGAFAGNSISQYQFQAQTPPTIGVNALGSNVISIFVPSGMVQIYQDSWNQYNQNIRQ